MSKRIFIVHGWDFNPEINWYPWLKEELVKKGFDVDVLEMPNTSEPKIKEWILYLKNKVGKLDDNTYFVGHSIGCQTIMRYLEQEKTKIGGVVFVAGWFNLVNLEGNEVEEIAEPWLKTKIDLQKVKNTIPKLTVILSDNDPYNCLEENSSTFKKLGGKIIIEKGKGHFTDDDNVDKLPSALKAILEIAK